MQCKKCGGILSETDKFCKNCGEPVLENNVQNFDTNNQQSNNQTIENEFAKNIQTNNYPNNVEYQSDMSTNQNIQNSINQDNSISVNQNINKKKSKKTILILAIIGGVLAGIVILFVVISSIILVISKNSVNTDYTNNTDNNSVNNSDSIDIDTTDYDTKIAGDEKYGYVTIPSDWYNFYDVDGTDALQYSYGNLYIVTLNIVGDEYSAKEYASAYMYNKQNSGEVTGITGATVTIGKDKEYTAYQVYMYYPSDSVYLITYWFETEDGTVRYIALEGPGSKITDYLFIPESFSLTK